MNMTYSAELIEVIDFSKREAIKLNYAQVHPKELLLGLMNVKSKAYNILQPYRNYIMDEINLPLNHTLARTTLQEKTLPFSPESVHLLHLSWQEAQKKCGANVQPEHLLLSMINDKSHEASSILLKLGLNVKELSWDFHLTHKIENGFGFAEEMPDELPEDSKSNSSQPSKSPTHPRQEKSDKGTPIIDKYGIDLTALAEEGALDPVVGRMKETERIAQILSRRKKNNPILIGEPGVGKSAIVEGLANLISTKKVPHNLIDKRIVSIDMASMVAGTQYRGQFEERLRSLIQELRSHNEIILFIDEIHTIIGAGSAPGSLDAANILKPALARGELQCIGATTIGEYKKSIEKDGALERRFQKILLEPTNAEETLQILKNIKDRYEEHHLVKYTDEALEACVYLNE